VTPVLRASTTPGKVDVDLDVEDELPLHGDLELNNRYSANTAQLRLVADVSYGNLFQTDQSASLQYQVAPQNSQNAQIGSFSYVIPTQNGPVFALYAVHSDSNIAAIGSLDIVGKGNIFGLRVIEPLESVSRLSTITSPPHRLQGLAAAGAAAGHRCGQSPARYTPFMLDYNATWLGAGVAQKDKAASTTGGRSSTTFEANVSSWSEPSAAPMPRSSPPSAMARIRTTSSCDRRWFDSRSCPALGVSSARLTDRSRVAR